MDGSDDSSLMPCVQSVRDAWWLGFSFLFLVPPNSPRIISEDRRIDTSKAIAGVYQEDDVMRLKCDVVGGGPKMGVLSRVSLVNSYRCTVILGRPLPSVTWWINGNLIDDSYFNEGTDTVVNRLQEMKAERWVGIGQSGPLEQGLSTIIISFAWMLIQLEISKPERVNNACVFWCVLVTYFRRHLDGAQIECRASNNNVSQPQSRILEIKINRKYLHRE